MIFVTLNNLGILHCNYVYIDSFKLFLRLIFGLHLQQVVKHFFFSSLIHTWIVYLVFLVDIDNRIDATSALDTLLVQ